MIETAPCSVSQTKVTKTRRTFRIRDGCLCQPSSITTLPVRGSTHPSLSLDDRRLEKPLLALQAALDGEALIKAVFRVLKGAVQCDFVSVCLCIVREAGRDVAYRMIDSRGFEYGTDLVEEEFFRDHPAMPTLMANPGIKFINTREILPPDQILRKSRFYREVMRVIGFRHAVGMFFWDSPPEVPEAIFSPSRAEGAVDFSDAEVARLDLLYPHIDAAFRRVRIVEKERAARAELRGLLRGAGRAACVLDWDLKVTEANRAAHESCARWHLGVESARLKAPPFRLPAHLRQACVELKTRWQASLKNSPITGVAARAEVRHPTGSGLRASVSLHPHPSNPFGKPGFLIEFAPAEPPRRSKPASDGKAAFRILPVRERELVQLICEGKSNQEIANETGRALGSVKNALHAIFLKLGVRSRSALIARVQRARQA